MAILGAALIVSNVGTRLVLARYLRREDAPVRFAWRRLYLSPMAWLGLILLVSSISRPAGGVVLLAFATGCGVVASLVMGKTYDSAYPSYSSP